MPLIETGWRFLGGFRGIDDRWRFLVKIAAFHRRAACGDVLVWRVSWQPMAKVVEFDGQPIWLWRRLFERPRLFFCSTRPASGRANYWQIPRPFSFCCKSDERERGVNNGTVRWAPERAERRRLEIGYAADVNRKFADTCPATRAELMSRTWPKSTKSTAEKNADDAPGNG